MTTDYKPTRDDWNEFHEWVARTEIPLREPEMKIKQMSKATKKRPATKKMTKVKSLSDLYQRAKTDERYQRLCICGLSNIGCEHFANQHRKHYPVKWEAYFRGYNDWLMSMCGEYDQPEGEAEDDLLDEINNVRDCIDYVELDWKETTTASKRKKV